MPVPPGPITISQSLHTIQLCAAWVVRCLILAVAKRPSLVIFRATIFWESRPNTIFSIHSLVNTAWNWGNCFCDSADFVSYKLWVLERRCDGSPASSLGVSFHRIAYSWQKAKNGLDLKDLVSNWAKSTSVGCSRRAQISSCTSAGTTFSRRNTPLCTSEACMLVCISFFGFGSNSVVPPGRRSISKKPPLSRFPTGGVWGHQCSESIVHFWSLV